MIITLEQVKRAQAKAQEIWDRYHCEEAENLIKKEVFVELIDYDDVESERQIEVLEELWEMSKEIDPKAYLGFDAIAIEFCKRLEMSVKLKSANII